MSPYSKDVPRCGQCNPEQAELAELVAKQHQLFAENFYCLRNVVQVLSRPDYQPVFAKPFTGGSPRPNPRNIGQRNLLTSFSSRLLSPLCTPIDNLTLNLEPLNF